MGVRKWVRGFEFEWEIDLRGENILGTAPAVQNMVICLTYFSHSNQNGPGESKSLGMVAAGTSGLASLTSL